MPEFSEAIIIRHGKTKYTEEGLDITDQGITETIKLAESLREEISKYSHLIVLSSPLARAKGTAEVFLDTLGYNCEPRSMRSIRCLDIRYLNAFSDLNKADSTEVYGEMWFTNPDLAKHNAITEGREFVNKRAIRFLQHMTAWMSRKAIELEEPVCVLAFTHFEIGTNYLFPLYPEGSVPSHENPGLKNSEAISVYTTTQDGILRIAARGLERQVRIINGEILPIN